MKQENSKFLYELIDFEGKKTKDVVKANNLFEAFSIVDGIYGLDDGLFQDVSIELLSKK